MKLDRLRITGFKTFVEPSEFLIRPGLTGIVGPNGCGKSNLVEALRWVMGENSYKSLRASGMDDVIFGGSGTRPARNTAEVMLSIDNGSRSAPAIFNDADVLEVSRKITREGGSTYRINGREVRARDVQLLFADAATGARSYAMVRQGQISEIIAAKPQARRRILEDAAGIAGLHSRRHEAELRLKAAEENLQRLDDIMRQIDGQLDGLRRQARQAQRYRELSAEIRKLEASALYLGWRQASEQLADATAASLRAQALASDCMEKQAETARLQGIAAHVLPDLRDKEADAVQQFASLLHERTGLEAEERRAQERAAELDRRMSELERDLERERALVADAATVMARLVEERGLLEEEQAEAVLDRESAAELVAEAALQLEQAEETLHRIQDELAQTTARRDAQEAALKQERARADRFAAEGARIEQDMAALSAVEDGEPDLLREEAETAAEATMLAEERVETARRTYESARAHEAASRIPYEEAERTVQRLDTELRTLARVIAPAEQGGFQPVLDLVEVEKGYEAALGAALGDDLQASLDQAAATYWRELGHEPPIQPLPQGVRPLAEVVQAPAAMASRLLMTGIVQNGQGDALQPHLAPGQRLVSPEGAVWRWDGLTSAADAPSAAARRLAERNRLADLRAALSEAQQHADAAHREAEAARQTAANASEAEKKALEAQRISRKALDGLRLRLVESERRNASTVARKAALGEALERITAAREETAASLLDIESALAILPPIDDNALQMARQETTKARMARDEALAALQRIQRESDGRTRRVEAIASEYRAWQEREQRADSGLAELNERLEDMRQERLEVAEVPGAMLLMRRDLEQRITHAEKTRNETQAARTAGEEALREAEQAARIALDDLARAREERARAEALHESAHERVSDIMRQIQDALGVTPEALPRLAGLSSDHAAPDMDEVEQRLATLKGDRERMGAINLRADDELTEAQGKRDGISTERDDLIEAIRRLRQAISGLNREGRERLLAAFSVVNDHFQKLFTMLFGGGQAELTLIDSEDPLEAGLEIYARPPGKKPQVMTLLSGGEQALTAIALIFAVFLTNPSPVCVLDEVDAPLDDANVERYCHLLHSMSQQTETRFIVITHNPITMAAMDRLFGVTMAERGISQLVSVDLERAEQILDHA